MADSQGCTGEDITRKSVLFDVREQLDATFGVIRQYVDFYESMTTKMAAEIARLREENETMQQTIDVLNDNQECPPQCEEDMKGPKQE